MCRVLSNSNYHSANKVILNCLVENMSNGGNLIQLCEYLQKIVPLSRSPESLASVLNMLRAGECIAIYFTYLHIVFILHNNCYNSIIAANSWQPIFKLYERLHLFPID